MGKFMGGLFRRSYLRLTSVANADPQTLPSAMLLTTCEFDTLSEDAEEWRLKKEAPSMDLRGRLFKGMGHGWDKMVQPGQEGHAERTAAYEEAVSLLVDLAQDHYLRRNTL